MEKEKYEKSKKEQLKMTVLLLIMALVSATVATVAWFTIADRTKVNSLNMDVTAGAALRFDLDPHSEFAEYIRTLNFAQIANRIQKDKGFDMKTVPLVPVTTSNCMVFTYQDGTVSLPTSGDYLEFTLHFMATKDMVVHLTSSDSSGGGKGTAITSQNPNLPKAMRISFTIGNETIIYDPGMAAESKKTNDIKTFGLPESDKMVYNDDNALFFIKKNQNVPVIVHIWMEGTDEACNDDLRGTDYSITMRFEGTDKNNNVLTDDHTFDGITEE